MKNTLAAKVIEGFHSQDWQALGLGGTWAGAIRPLEAYVNRKIKRAVKAEREACAKVCEDKAREWRERSVPLLGYSGELEDCAAAIRARKP